MKHNHYTTVLILLSLSLLMSHDAFAQWQASNNGVQSYTAHCLIQAPDGSVIVGTENGIFRSENFGDSWTISSNGINAGDSTILRITSNNGRLFVGTAENIYYSDNNGVTWTLSTSFGNSTFGLSNSQGEVFAGTIASGIHKSIDNGSGWTGANSGLTTDSVFSLHVSNGAIYAGTYSQGIFRSVDQGGSWNQVLSDNDPLRVKSLASTASKLFAAGTILVNSSSPFYAPFVSNNDGQSWSVYYSPDLPTPGNFYVSAMYGTGSSVLFAGGGSIYLSTDNGSSWSTFMNGFTAIPPFGVACFVETSDYIFCCLEGGGAGPVFRVPKIQVTTAIKELRSDKTTQLSENPSKGDMVSLEYNIQSGNRLLWRIDDAGGRFIHQQEILGSKGKAKLNKLLKSGIYLSTILEGNTVVDVQRLVVSN